MELSENEQTGSNKDTVTISGTGFTVMVNGNKIVRGQKMEDGSYYMGISPDTETGFFLFIESAGRMSWDVATTDLEQKHKDNVEFKGHKYSEFQTESKIIASYKNGTADGGLRRLTLAEWQKAIGAVFNISELRELAKELIEEVLHDDFWIQTASEIDNANVWSLNIRSGRRSSSLKNNDHFVLLGYSAKKNAVPQPV